MRIVVPILLFLLLPGRELNATLELEFQYFDNSNQDFAARGWLDSNSLFQQNIRAATALWAETFDSNAGLQVHVTANRNVTELGVHSVPAGSCLPIQRLAEDNVALCKSLNEAAQ